ncbi:NosD domain-containing protein [Shivajiella indica]|uniref:NosD domain-containing protein n=1 Tax=Shivajiella indica TaxID=872115 RepID=A0ABW5B6S8_9BACT
MKNKKTSTISSNAIFLNFILVLLIFLGCQAMVLAQRTYSVNTTEDFEDVDLSDKICADKNGKCTLRAAIQNANTSKLRDKILFELNEYESKRIVLQTFLPAIIYPIEIYGTNNRKKIDPRDGIIIDGSRIGFDLEIIRTVPEASTGLLLAEKSSGSVINGLIFQSIRNMAIKIDSHNSVIQNNIFGSLEKDPKKGNGAGVSVWGKNNLIGGQSENEVNYFFGNSNGVSCITGISNKIIGNIFGYDSKKDQIRGNVIAVFLGFPSQDNLILGNLISGNTMGMEIWGIGNKVVQNKIGTDYYGSRTIGNKVGIVVNSSSHLISIGGINQGNLISGNEVGILIDTKIRSMANFQSVRERFLNIEITGNLIGTDYSGQFPLGNENGIVLRNSGGIIIGGVQEGLENIISGNLKNGILLIDSFENLVSGNKIGTDISGNYAIPNAVGIRIYDEEKLSFSDNNVIHGNLISGNINSGIYIGKEVKKLNIISNIFCGGVDLDFPSENQNIGIVNTSSIIGICLGDEYGQNQNIFSNHNIGIITIMSSDLQDPVMRKNKFLKNSNNVKELDSEDSIEFIMQSFISNYFKIAEKEYLQLGINKFQYDSTTISQLQREIDKLPD